MKRGDIVWLQRAGQQPEQHTVQVVEYEVTEDGDDFPMYFLLRPATGELVEIELRNGVWREVQWIPIQLTIPE